MLNLRNALLSARGQSSSQRRPRPSAFGWTGYFLFLYVYRCIFSVLSQLVVLRLTPVSDTFSYQRGELPGIDESQPITAGLIFELGSTQFSTILTARIGGLFNALLFGNPILINMGFQTIAFVGLLYFLKSVDDKARRPMALLILLPSFTVWSSIASKEAIVVFAVAILSGFLLRMYQGRARLGVLPIIAGFLIFLYKPYFFAAFAFALIGTWICQRVRQKATLALIGGMLSIALLYMLRDTADELAFALQQLFSYETAQGRSSRLEPFFVEQYDVFFKAPAGMLLAFFGPMITEILVSPLALVTFIESAALAAFLGVIFAYRFMYLPAYSLILGSFTLFWIMFPSYPFGVGNIGTAIRYRTGWLVLLFAVVGVLMSRDLFLGWQAKQGKRRSATM